MACCKCCCEAGASPGVCCGGQCCREPDACCGGVCCAYPNSCCGGECCGYPNECVSDGSSFLCCPPSSTFCGGSCCEAPNECLSDDNNGFLCCPPGGSPCNGLCCPDGRVCCSDICCPPDSVCCKDVNGNRICCPADECVNDVCGNYCLALHTAITVSALGKTIYSTMPVLEYPDKPNAVFWREARNPACDVFGPPAPDGLAGYQLCFAVADRTGLNCASGGGFGVCPNNPTPPSGMEGACCAFVRIMYHCQGTGSCDNFFELATATIWFKGTNVTVTQPAARDGCPDLTVSAGIVNIGAPPENPLP